jgi:hypothetical protein
MSAMRLDEERLEALRTWGENLRQSGGEESAAVGRAILMLVEEIDRLHIELWHARMPPSADAVSAGDASEEPVASSLHARLQGILRRGRAETDVEDAQPRQAWLTALRRQK